MSVLRAGAALSVSMFTVVPVRAARLDRDAAAVALALAPMVGALLGALLGAAAAGLTALGAPALLAGLLAVGLGAAATRGLHLDGLADLADGLGSHAPPERALAIMRDPGTGAFAVVWLVLVLGVQAVSLGGLAARGPADAVLGGAVACAAGRAGFVWCARRGVPAASPDGLGALVAGTQPGWLAPLWGLVLAGLGVVAVSGRWWQGPVAVAVAVVVVVVVAGHARRRLAGVSGDVFGATCELAVTGCVAALALG